MSRIAGMTRGGREALYTAATKIIAGVGTMHMIEKGRLRCHQGLVVSDADRFYNLVTR